MALSNTIYNAVFKRTSTFILAVAGGTFFFERTFDAVADYIWERNNKGKLWKDIKHKYEQE